MMRAVGDLTTASPHMRTRARFTVQELHAYHEGYYTGLVFALKVLDEAVQNYKDVTRTRRRERKLKKGA